MLQKITQLLAAAGDSPQQKQRALEAGDRYGRTPLIYAAYANQATAVALLLSNGASIKARASDGTTALHEAARRSTKDVVQMLVDHGAEVAARDGLGRTPLHWAADNSIDDCVAVLAKAKGVAMNVADDAGLTPIMYAAAGQRVHLVKKFLDLKSDLEEKDCLVCLRVCLLARACNVTQS
jgi:ankyrin repeat protein